MPHSLTKKVSEKFPISRAAKYVYTYNWTKTFTTLFFTIIRPLNSIYHILFHSLFNVNRQGTIRLSMFCETLLAIHPISQNLLRLHMILLHHNVFIHIHILLMNTITMLKLQLSLTFFEHLHQKFRILLMNFSIWLCVWMECDHVGLCSMVFEWKSFSFYSKLVGNRNCGLTLKFSHYLVNPDLVFHH